VKYIIDLENQDIKLKSNKINAILRVTKLGIPTIPNPHVILPEVFEHYISESSFPDGFERELEDIFRKITSTVEGNSVAVRPSVWAKKARGLEFIESAVNISTFKKVLSSLKKQYKEACKLDLSKEQIEFAVLLPTFHSQTRCGHMFTTYLNNRTLIEGVFGELVEPLAQGKVEGDKYEIDRDTGYIARKEIVRKEFTIIKGEGELIEKALPTERHLESVISDGDVATLYSYAEKLEEKYGPQEVEWGVLKSGRIIVFDSRDLNAGFSEMQESNMISLYPGEISGKIHRVDKEEDIEQHQSEVILTDNLDPNFITLLVFMGKPRAVILTKGAITSHSATILRESKIPTVLIRDCQLRDGDHITISKDGFINKK